jgi:dienelactone hydrolase
MPPLMRLLKLLFALLVLGTLCGQIAPPSYSPRGPEEQPNRAQQWLIPSSASDRPAHAVLFRPSGDGPFRLAVIVHASTQNVLRRAQMPQPEYRALAAFLTARGFAVLVPERLGHGATGGNYLEDQGGCDEADYARSARATAAQIALAHEFMRGQPFIRKDGAAIIAFAPGRGGHANDVPNQVCAPQNLIATAALFGKTARVPVTWLVAANDSYFSPELSRRLTDAFHNGGDRVDFHVLAASGSEGHWMVETESGVKIAGPALDRALRLQPSVADKKR